MISGHITICKIYKDGTKETVLDKSNLITKGLGSAYIDILEEAGSVMAEDYRPRYFQIGTSSMDYDEQPVGTDTSAYFYQLSAPLHWSSYGNDTNLLVKSRPRGFYASTINPGELTPGEAGQVTGTELVFSSAPLSSAIFSSVETSSNWFGSVKQKDVVKWFIDSCEVEIILDEETANDSTISEIGLFSKNPRGAAPITPLLMAYKKFTGIPKSSAFSLAFHWNIGFMGTSSLDRNYTGGSSEILPKPSGYVDYYVDSKGDMAVPGNFDLEVLTGVEGDIIDTALPEDGGIPSPETTIDPVPDVPTPPGNV